MFRVLVLGLSALGVAACGGNEPAQQPSARVELGPPPAEAVQAAQDTGPDRPVEPAAGEREGGEPLPSLPVDQVERSGESWPRIESLEAVNQDLRTVLRSVAQQYGLEFRLDPNVRGRVTTTLRDATLREALDAIVLPHGYTYQLDGRTLRVEPARLVSRMFDLDFISISRVGVGTTVIQRRLGSTFGGATGTGRSGVGTGSAATGGVGAAGVAGGADVITTVEVTDLWEDIRVALEGLVFAEVRSPQEAGLQQRSGTGLTGGLGGRAPQTTSRVGEDGRRLIVNPAAGTILITASPRVLEEVELFLNSFESAIQRQVRIEAKFVEVVLDREYEFGVNWSAVQQFGDFGINLQSTPTGGGLEFSLAGNSGSVTAVLDALETQGDVRVLSSPGVTALNNQRAVFNVTTEEVFFAVTREPIRDASGNVIQFQTSVETQPVAVGIVMDVLPQISTDDVITMNVRPMVTSLKEIVEFEQDDNFARAPVVDRRELDTMVRVRSGETHVIGGLIQTREEETRSGVPVLKNLPVLGWLFGRTVTRERRSELVIFITPTIIAGTTAAP